MKKHARILSVALGSLAALGLGAAAPPGGGNEGEKGEFDELSMYIEFNSVDNDAGVQVFLDADEWKSLRITGPGNKRILDLKASSGLREIGLTELFFEGAEPSPPEVLAAFPAGDYEFEAKTIDGEVLEGTATLSHEFPPAPVVSPSNGELVDLNNTVITWGAVPGAVKYQVIVEQEDLLDVEMIVEVLPPTTSLHVPPTFLQPNTEYKVELIVIAATGNRTISEGPFVTLP